MDLTNREKEILYFALLRLSNDDSLTNVEFMEIDVLKDRFYTENELPKY
jgi:hypothetical protein